MEIFKDLAIEVFIKRVITSDLCTHVVTRSYTKVCEFINNELKNIEEVGKKGFTPFFL